MKCILTQKQQYILNFIDEFSSRERMSPTIDEIAKQFQVTTTTVFAHLRALQRKGFVDRSSKARSLSLTRSNSPKHLSASLSIPILGRISAGLPLLAEQNIDETIHMDPSMLPWGISGQRLFGLRIDGESMRDKGMLDGDIIIAKEQSSAQIGNIVIALVTTHNEATVKSFYLSNHKIELRPANADFESQFYDFDDVLLQGVVIALYRKYRV